MEFISVRQLWMDFRKAFAKPTCWTCPMMAVGWHCHADSHHEHHSAPHAKSRIRLLVAAVILLHHPYALTTCMALAQGSTATHHKSLSLKFSLSSLAQRWCSPLKVYIRRVFMVDFVWTCIKSNESVWVNQLLLWRTDGSSWWGYFIERWIAYFCHARKPMLRFWPGTQQFLTENR